jgi:hypothetical protein
MTFIIIGSSHVQCRKHMFFHFSFSGIGRVPDAVNYSSKRTIMFMESSTMAFIIIDSCHVTENICFVFFSVFWDTPLLSVMMRYTAPIPKTGLLGSW